MPTATIDALRERVEQRQLLCEQIKELIIDRLDPGLEIDWITDDQPLFGRGLELDSVDSLELVIGLEFTFGVAPTDDQVGVLGSVNTMADFVEGQQ